MCFVVHFRAIIVVTYQTPTSTGSASKRSSASCPSWKEASGRKRPLFWAPRAMLSPWNTLQSRWSAPPMETRDRISRGSKTEPPSISSQFTRLFLLSFSLSVFPCFSLLFPAFPASLPLPYPSPPFNPLLLSFLHLPSLHVFWLPESLLISSGRSRATSVLTSNCHLKQINTIPRKKDNKKFNEIKERKKKKASTK